MVDRAAVATEGDALSAQQLLRTRGAERPGLALLGDREPWFGGGHAAGFRRWDHKSERFGKDEEDHEDRVEHRQHNRYPTEDSINRSALRDLRAAGDDVGGGHKRH